MLVFKKLTSHIPLRTILSNGNRQYWTIKHVIPSTSSYFIHDGFRGPFSAVASSCSYGTCTTGAPTVVKLVPPVENANTESSSPSTNSGSTSVTKRSLKRKAIITLRPAAIEKLKQLQTTQKTDSTDSNTFASNLPIYLKISVKNKGCSGSAYAILYTQEKGKFDEIVQQDGVSVLIDAKALLSIIGSEVDYIQNDLTEQFVFYNPNVKETCGCGLSFTI